MAFPPSSRRLRCWVEMFLVSWFWFLLFGGVSGWLRLLKDKAQGLEEEIPVISEAEQHPTPQRGKELGGTNSSLQMCSSSQWMSSPWMPPGMTGGAFQ